jgi:glycerol-3-phosphate dehydrogenase
VAGIAEIGKRDWQEPGNGGIVCHCELVTRREINQALDGPLAPGGLAGLKRRTRAGMGRCQGFYCSAELCELTEERLSQSLAVTRK